MEELLEEIGADWTNQSKPKSHIACPGNNRNHDHPETAG